MRSTSIILAVLAACLIAPAIRAQGISQVPDAGNLDDWMAFIRPSKSELAYEKIGWRSKFWPAVEEARKLGRPILLWTMNGHPLGCT